MNVSAPFINRPVMTTFVMISLFIAGWIAFTRLPVSDLPTIEHPHIEVTAGYLGASPETVLNQVTIPLEKELTHVKGIQELNSTSSPGYSTISLKFDLSKDMSEAIRDVQSALNRAEHRLPKEVDPRPTYHLQEDSQDPIMYFMLTSDNLSVAEMRQYSDTYIIPRLSRLEGVAQVKAFGTEKALWLRLNPELMAARHIGFNQVMEAIRQHTATMPLGTIQTSSKRLAIELPNTIQQANDLANIKIGQTDVRLKDIGEISNKSENEREFHFVTKDKISLALILAIQKVSDGNTVAIAKNVNEAVEAIKKELPNNLSLKLWFDKSVWIKESLWDVQWSLLFAFALVIFVIYLSLGRWSESLITSISLPLSLVGTFIIMYFAHFSLDLLSLLALTLCVGFVVDDAIVVLENIVRTQEKGNPPKLASLLGSKQICFTVISMTISLVAVFIPLLFMSGINGRLFREFSITLAVAILVSGFVSLTLTPMLCSKFLSVHKEHSKLQKWINRTNEWLLGVYGNSLRVCFSYRKTIASLAIICACLTVWLFTKLPVNLIPSEDRGFFFAFVNLPAGMGPSQIKDKQKLLEDLVRQKDHIDNFLCLNYEGNLLFVVRLDPISKRPPQQEIIADLQKTLDTIPGTQTFIQPYQLINMDLDFGNAGQFQFILTGMEFAEVDKATQELTKAMQAHPEYIFVQNSLRNDSPMLAMHYNEVLTHQLGFNKQQIQNLLQNAFGQASVGKIQKGSTEEKIYMELQSEYQNHADAAAQLYLTTAEGDLVPFKSLVNWEEKLGSPSLTRREQLPSSTIRFSLAEHVHPNLGLKLTEEISQEVLPENVKGLFSGTAKAISSTINDTLLLFLAAIIVMYIVLGILYESFIHPLTILSSLPFAGLGGVLTLYAFEEPISIFSAVGFLLLIGIVKKNGIMMVDYAIGANKLEDSNVEVKDLNSEQSMSLSNTPSHLTSNEKSIFEACMVRFRPIMMTTVAAIMGAIPIAIGFGDGAEMRRGLGLVIVGGLLFSQVLTLYVTPILYLCFTRKSRY